MKRRKPHIRMTARLRAELALIYEAGEELEARRRRALAEADQGTDTARLMALSHVAVTVARRWAAAGYTTYRLDKGVPVPALGHAADWAVDGYFATCRTCGHSVAYAASVPTCPGRPAAAAILDALDDGVRLEIGPDGLPVAVKEET